MKSIHLTICSITNFGSVQNQSYLVLVILSLILMGILLFWFFYSRKLSSLLKRMTVGTHWRYADMNKSVSDVRIKKVEDKHITFISIRQDWPNGIRHIEEVGNEKRLAKVKFASKYNYQLLMES